MPGITRPPPPVSLVARDSRVLKSRPRPSQVPPPWLLKLHLETG